MAWLLVAGCSAGGGRHDDAVVLAAKSDDAVVATVDGRPIYAAAVAVQARARGVDVNRALQDLIDAEALAGEAARRGLRSDPVVHEATQGALVRRYLQTTFEREVTSAQVPLPLVQRAYERNRSHYVHPPLVDVWHILVPVAAQAKAGEREAARSQAAALAIQAKGTSLEEFKALAGPLRLEEVVTGRDDWTEPAFSHAAFDQLHHPGDTSGVVETSYGYHVQYLVRFIPAAQVALDEATPELRAGLLPEVRRKAFSHFLDEAMTHHRVVTHPERLATPATK